jgi:DNA-binding PadR family transcriptional regulator
MRVSKRIGGRRHDHPHPPAHDHGEFRRMRHGDVRAALLLSLQDGPGHGYELGQRLERASGGAWRPSPGSIYPTLQLLADEELVRVTERDGKRIYELAKAGLAELKARAARGEANPWLAASEAPSSELKEAVHVLREAARQINHVGDAEQVAAATAIVVEARRKLYALLGER